MRKLLLLPVLGLLLVAACEARGPLPPSQPAYSAPGFDDDGDGGY